MSREPRLLFVTIENSEAHFAPVLGFCSIAAVLKEELHYGNIQQLNVVYTDTEIYEKILQEQQRAS